MILSRLWRSNAAPDVTAIGLGGIGASVAAAPQPAFRALYAVEAAGAPAPEPYVAEPEGDPLEQARIEAFTMGYEEGCRVTAEACAQDEDAIERLVDAIQSLAPAASGSLSTMLSSAVIRLVGQIVGEVDVDVALLRQRCEAVAAFIEDGESKTALHLHPEDVPLIESVGIGVPVIADPALRRGSVRLDTAEGWIEDGPDVRLSRLRAMMDDMEGRL